MKQVRDVLQLHSVMNLSLRRIQGATNVAKSTISDYIKRFNDSGLNIEQINILDDDALKLKLFPEHTFVVVSKKAMPDMNYLHKEMKLRKKTKITMQLLWKSILKIILMAIAILSLDYTTAGLNKHSTHR